jgi:hypothetical protein
VVGDSNLLASDEILNAGESVAHGFAEGVTANLANHSAASMRFFLPVSRRASTGLRNCPV